MELWKRLGLQDLAKEQAQYGWMMSNVLEMSHQYQNAVTADGDYMIVIILKMLAYAVQAQVKYQLLKNKSKWSSLSDILRMIAGEPERGSILFLSKGIKSNFLRIIFVPRALRFF